MSFKRLSSFYLVLVLWHSLALCLSVGESGRGRVRVQAPAVVSDWGTPLRGCCWGLDRNRTTPTRQQLAALKQCGLNTFHVYCELTTSSSGKPVGYNATNMDSIVTWCRQESLYVIMTHGGPIKETPLQKILDIWKFYAPRYADQTHVIYEIKNEGCYETFHCAEPVLQMYKDAYKIIRESAPETHVMLLSHSNLKGGINSLWEDIERFGDDIDWSNASIAFHGYGTTGAFQAQAAEELGAEGYAMTCTEFPVNMGLHNSYEAAGISYCHFFNCYPPLTSICGHVKSLGLSYAPDFGSWPQEHVDQIPVDVHWRLGETPGGRSGTAGRRLVFGAALPAGTQAVYDVRGRLLWRSGSFQEGQRIGGDGPTGRLGASMFLFQYWVADR